MKDTFNAEVGNVGRSRMEVWVARAKEAEWFDQQLGEHHYLGAGRPVGGIPVQLNQLQSLIARQIISPSNRAQRDLFSSEPGVQGGAFDS
jgi:hypothetical protein